MKWVRTLIIFDKGNISATEDWQAIHEGYCEAIRRVEYPEGAGVLRIRRKHVLDGRLRRNGVQFLKRRFLHHMTEDGTWQAEAPPQITPSEDEPLLLYPDMRPYQMPPISLGGFDFKTTTDGGLRVVIEWETGNISSSHRSMNKMAIALGQGVIDAGILLVPTRPLYRHLTDRIGNFEELRGYLRMWQGLRAGVRRGLLVITAVEHDEETDDPMLPLFDMGDDGNARRGRGEE